MGYPLDKDETLDALSRAAAENEIAKGFRDDILLANSIDQIRQSFLDSPDQEIVVATPELLSLLERASASIKRNLIGMKIALAHSELSEALARSRDLTVEQLLGGDEKFTRELADANIRIYGLADLTGGNIGRATMDTMKANQDRPYKHGRMGC